MIVLVRHGPSISPSLKGLLERDDMVQWRTRYDEVGILPDSRPSDALAQMARDARHIVASDLIRSVESAERLVEPQRIQTSELLRESALPIPHWPTRLPFSLWASVITAQWMLRVMRGTDANAADLARARAATDMLTVLSPNEESVVVVTHGVFRRLVANELLRRGWKSAPRIGGYQNWSHWTFQRTTTTP